MNGITIATALGGIATKQVRRTGAGLAFTHYPNEKWWRFREVVTPPDVVGWAEFFAARANDIASCCLYARPIYDSAEYQRRLIHPTADSPATLREVRRDILILDFDSASVAMDQDFLANPTGAIGSLIDGIPDLSGSAFAYSVSCTAGFKPGVRAKAVVLLADALLPTQMRRWAKAANARAGVRVIDPAVLAPAQPLYLARPILHGIIDPFPSRVGVRAGAERVRLHVPSEASPPGSLGNAPSSTSGWQSHLSRLGPQGFHDALLTAAGAVVRDQCGAPAEPTASVIHQIVHQAVLGAEPGARSQTEIARYASRRFWDDAINHAAQREQNRFGRIAASVAGIRRS